MEESELGKNNGTIPLYSFPDNHDPAFEVELSGIKDITAAKRDVQIVTRGDIREMFLRFMNGSSELLEVSREE